MKVMTAGETVSNRVGRGKETARKREKKGARRKKMKRERRERMR